MKNTNTFKVIFNKKCLAHRVHEFDSAGEWVDNTCEAWSEATAKKAKAMLEQGADMEEVEWEFQALEPGDLPSDA